MRVTKRALLTFFAIGLVFAMSSAPASADTTHVFEEFIEISSGNNVEPVGVDSDGNLIVWLNEQHAVAKFDKNGDPVNFSGLGTNMIDGAGPSHDCPLTPSDCDQVPTTNGFTTETHEGNEIHNVVGIDSSGGPADGYIYVLNNYVSGKGTNEGEIDVFAPSGVYLGKLDESQVTPDRGGLEEYFLGGVSVAPNGVVYVVTPGAHLTLTHVDRYVPVDGDPAHTQFAGQIRAACANAVCVDSYAGFAGGAGATDYYYAWGYDQTHSGRGANAKSSFYMRFPMDEFHRPGLLNFAVSDDFAPDNGPFGNGGYFGPFNMNLAITAVDPATEHVYIGEGWAGFQEWDENNEQVGPMFANENCPGSGTEANANCRIGIYGQMDSIAFDRSGGPDDGKIYVRGPLSRQIAVFSPPVTIPDINDPTATTGHTTADLSINVGRAGGPPVTDCHVEYGFKAPSLSDTYTGSEPCDVPTPYTEGETDVEVEFSGLFAETDYHYQIVTGNNNGLNKSGDRVFHTVAILGLQADPATDVTQTSGDLNGSLNPDGMDTSYHFEYGISTQYNNRTPERDIGSGSGQESVSPESISGLQPGRIYHYRIVAKNQLGKTRSADETFLVPGNPAISGVRATNVTESTADLNARVNPLGFNTTYHFEYGPTPSYGHVTPEITVGAQVEPQPVSAHIEDLPPGITRFRIVAENKWGVTASPDSAFNFFPPGCPNSHVRQQTRANYLPDCRAYEIVSPGSAGNVTLFPGEITKGASGGFSFGPELAMTAPNAGAAANSPPRFGYMGGEGAIPGLNPPNGLMDRYVATRTNAGWQTTYPGRQGDETLIAARPVCDLAMETCIDYRIPPLLGAGGGTASNAPYVWNVSGKSLGRWPTNLDLVPNGDQGVRDARPSADFSHFVFGSATTPFAPGGLDAPPGTVYDNDIAQKSVRIASYTPSGDPIPQVDSPSADPNRQTEIAAVSTDGSHILMAATTNPACDLGSFPFNCQPKLSFPAHLYMRVDGLVTHEVTNGAIAKYLGMTADGSKVFFTSEEGLTAADTDESIDLYQWSESGSPLTLLSQGNGNGNADDCTALWASGCDIRPVTTERPDIDDSIASESGDIYFYSPEQLDPASPGVRNERNLYVYKNGSPHYVSTMDPGTQVDRMQVAPDGDHMAFLTRSQATAYVNVAPNDNGAPTQWQEMYLYTPSTGSISCASCIPSGEPPTVLTTDTGFAASTHNYDVKASQSGRFMSDDGRVAFATADALAPADTNLKIDVYEFADNRAQLITTGSGERDTQGGAVFYPTLHTGLESISHDGVDLYFSTFETLVPEDHNGSFVKFYDARSNGGFAIPSTLLPCTAADECHGDPSVAVPDPGMGTLGDLGSGGNHNKAAKKKAQKKKKKKKGKKGRKGKQKRHHRESGR